MRTFTLAQFARHVATLAKNHQNEINAGLAAVAQNTHRHAHRIFGDDEKLQELAASTVADKSAKGYDHPEDPLVATGEMRDTLQWGQIGPVSAVGSEDEKMVWHHTGGQTGRDHDTVLPPRPVLTIAVREAEEENTLILSEFVARSIGLNGRIPRSTPSEHPPSTTLSRGPSIGSDLRD